MLTKILLITGAVLLASMILLFILWKIKQHTFQPTKNKDLQETEINKTLYPFGFAYTQKGDYFYSLMYAWQRKFGYCALYDENAAFFNMIMHCEPITFTYQHKKWLIEFWKGQYGIATGAEIGIYATDKSDIQNNKFSGTFYESINDRQRLKMSFVLKKDHRTILKRKGLHWWLTAFKLGEFSNPSSLTMRAKITFPEVKMRNAFINALQSAGYSSSEYKIRAHTVFILFTNPHTPQPKTQTGIFADTVQIGNENNCLLFHSLTDKYTDTLDKLEFLKSMAPNLYKVFTTSIHPKDVFKSFEWINKETLKNVDDSLPNSNFSKTSPPVSPSDSCKLCRCITQDIFPVTHATEKDVSEKNSHDKEEDQ